MDFIVDIRSLDVGSQSCNNVKWPMWCFQM